MAFFAVEGAELLLEGGLLEGGLFGAEAAVGGAELAEVGAVEMTSLEAPEVLSSDFLSVAQVSELPAAEIQQVETFTLPETIESDFMAVPDVAELEVPELAPAEDVPMYDDAEINQFVEEEFGAEEVGAEDELVEQRVDLNDTDFDYRQLADEPELQEKDFFQQMKDLKNEYIDEPFENLLQKFKDSPVGQRYQQMVKLFNEIKTHPIFKIGKYTLSLTTIYEFYNDVKNTIKRGEEIRDMSKEFEKWVNENIPEYKDKDNKNKPTQPEKTPTEPTNEGQLSYDEMTNLVKTFNNKQETIEFLAKHKTEYDSLSQEQKNQLLLLARQNF